MIDFYRGRTFCVSHLTSVNHALKRMIENKRSSVLIYNAEEKIVGILTERDIIRKISTIRVDVSLDKPINTVMSRSVKFVHESTLLNDIKALHLGQGIRHFPVLRDRGDPVLEDVVGMVTVTDLARAYLENL